VLKDLLTQGWAYHATESARFAGELEASADAARQTPDQLARYLRVSTHTIGEHLGDWARARRLGDVVLAGLTPSTETAKAWAHLAIARLLAGDAAGAAEAEIAWLGAATDGVAAAAIELKFMLVSALVGGGQAAEATPIYLAGLDLARRQEVSSVCQTASAVSNALATELLEAPSRTADAAALMRIAADAAHEFAVKSGGWYDEFCGHYLKALVANVAGEPDTALAHVDQGMALIVANGRSPIDEAFLHLTRAHAYQLRGEPNESRLELSRSDAIAAGFDKPGLLAWHAEERARVFPNLPPRLAKPQSA
jgi:hypothetical protein